MDARDQIREQAPAFSNALAASDDPEAAAWAAALDWFAKRIRGGQLSFLVHQEFIRSYTQTMNRLRRDLGDQAVLTQLTAERAAEVFEVAWGGSAARTWNRHRSALRSFTTWASAPARGYLHTDLAGLIDRRPEIQDRTRAIDRHQIDALWERKDLALREKTLYRMLYESAARTDSVLALNIEDLDQANKRGKITAKGGTIIWIHWQSGTARLLPRLIAGRTRGPLFLADR